MARYVDLSEQVTATFYSEEFEEWTQQTVTIEDVLDSVCDDYTVIEPHRKNDKKKGKWIRLTQGAIPEEYMCPFCRRIVESYYEGAPYRDFCPNCGADMRQEAKDG